MADPPQNPPLPPTLTSLLPQAPPPGRTLVMAGCDPAVGLLLQELAGEPAWMADLVDITPAGDTAVIWHCGLAPLSMRDPEVEAEATIHTNRRMPLLHQFPIKPGRITLARISRARNEVKLMIAGAEVIRAPMAFTGCSGTIRFDRPAAEVQVEVPVDGDDAAALAGEHLVR